MHFKTNFVFEGWFIFQKMILVKTHGMTNHCIVNMLREGRIGTKTNAHMK